MTSLTYTRRVLEIMGMSVGDGILHDITPMFITNDPPSNDRADP